MKILLLFAISVVQAQAAELSLLRLVNKARLVSILLTSSRPPEGLSPSYLQERVQAVGPAAAGRWEVEMVKY